MKHTLLINLVSLLLFFSCSSSENSDLNQQDNTLINRPFTQGIIEMGIFSHEVNLGKIIEKIDFSREDIAQQYQDLLTKDQQAKTIFEIIEKAGAQHPLVSMAMAMNISQCTYYIKESEVLGKARGFGWIMNNYHNGQQDKGSIYLETLTHIDQIPLEDRQIYTVFTPSQSASVNATNSIDLNEYNRQIRASKENILGYLCDVVEYTPKIQETAPGGLLQKIVVYTSPLMDKTINFTHPFYLEENGGILRLDIYYINQEQPTLVMKPITIKEQLINPEDLRSKTSTPIYGADNINWGFKALAIMLSGWGAIQNDHG